jgi:outer membrane receptor for ferrienterochelin and colicins
MGTYSTQNLYGNKKMGVHSGLIKIRLLIKSLRRISVGAGFALLSFGSFAAEDAHSNDAALQDLLQVLDQKTEIATKTKMNVDFVPGMVTVLYGEDLLARGISTVEKAITLIPSVELSFSSDGQSQVFVRGIGTSFSSGKIKVLVNGVPFNSTLSAATTALRLPIEQVDRIEVIRGPGSAIYGEFAYSGVINIVTRKDQDRAFLRYGNLGNTTAGGMLTRTFDNDLSMNLSFSGTYIKGESVNTGYDVLRSSPFAGLSNSPGISNERERDSSLIFNTKYRETNLSVQYIKLGTGDYFGYANALPSYNSKIMHKLNMLTVNAEHHWSLADDLNVNAYAGWHDYQLDTGLLELYPPGINFGAGSFPDGVIGSPNYKERKYRIGAELHYEGWDRHDILAGVEWLYTKQGDTYAERNYDPNTTPISPIPLAKYRGAENWLQEGLIRRVYGLYAQDQIALTDRFTTTAGLRFDAYDDVGNDVSPRIAAVYKLMDHHIFKAQYARAFRPPTFMETATRNNPVVTGNPDLESEHLSSYELGYIFNDEVNRLRTTLFYEDLHDLIVLDSTAKTYVNQGEVHTRGIELEYTRNFGRKIKVDANVSYFRPWNKTTKETIANIADTTVNLELLYRFTHNYSLTTQFRYVGKRKREKNDPRKDFKEFSTIDFTFTANNVANSGLTAHAGVTNLLDTKIVYPSPMVTFAGATLPAYQSDYPRPGREFWYQVDYRF